jgi:hypothetical protein
LILLRTILFDTTKLAGVYSLEEVTFDATYPYR